MSKHHLSNNHKCIIIFIVHDVTTQDTRYYFYQWSGIVVKTGLNWIHEVTKNHVTLRFLFKVTEMFDVCEPPPRS